jgi:DNA-binding transcriptional MerR regulator
MQRTTHSTDEVCTRAKVTKRQIHYWINNGWVNPIDTAPGSGYAMSFSGDELRRVKLMGELVRAGIHPADAHRLTLWGERDDNGVFRSKLAGHVYVEVFP